MQTAEHNQSLSRTGWRIGWALSIFGILFTLFDATIHLIVISPVVDAFNQLGVPAKFSVTLAVLEFICIILYLIPNTCVLGAVLFTGYLGGAMAIQMRIEAPLFSTLLFPFYTGIILWGGIYLRNKKLRDIIPFIKT